MMETPKKRQRNLSQSPNSIGFDDLFVGQSSLSPKFMKPCDVFKRRKQKKLQQPSPSKAQARKCQLMIEKHFSPLKCLQQSSNLSLSSSTPSSKSITFSPLMKKLQRSPIRISFPVVRKNPSTSFSKCSSTSSTILRSSPSKVHGTFNRVLNFDEDAQLPETNVFDQFKNSKLGSSDNCNIKNFFPLNAPNLEWSLKTRMRVITNCPVPFQGSQLKAIDECCGLNRFVRGVKLSNNTSIWDSFASELQRSCMVWQHPSLPWTRLFPREPELKPGTHLKSKNSQKPVFTLSATGTLADSLHSDFCHSLHSLFKLLKTKLCPYFYFCANNFTVLFRASGVAGSDEIHALISPTTLGFRKLLEDEGITFSMPFHSASLSPNFQQSETTSSSVSMTSDLGSDLDEDDEEELDQRGDIEEESNQWLESMGLSQQDFPSLENSSLRRRRQRRMIKDPSIASSNQLKADQSGQAIAKSLIRIQGSSNIQALVELFINHRKACVSASGPLAGIPPTLLSPVAFSGATLNSIPFRQRIIDQQGNQGKSFVFDFNGAILPHTVFGLMSLFSRICLAPSSKPSTGSGVTFVRSTLRVYDSSASFAMIKSQEIEQELKNDTEQPITSLMFNPAFSVENLEESGLDKRFLMAICSHKRQFDSLVKTFEMSPNGIRYNRHSNIKNSVISANQYYC